LDYIAANLPAIDLKKTSDFYQKLGFKEDFRDLGWLMMSRGDLKLEFFPYCDLDPYQSSFSACVRVADLDCLYNEWNRLGLPSSGIPRLTPPQNMDFGLRMAALVDENGSLLRLIGPLSGQ
jgi:catechol 2,3-dioxygenase-like lactoylglutathione lyase family enzyme